MCQKGARVQKLPPLASLVADDAADAEQMAKAAALMVRLGT